LETALDHAMQKQDWFVARDAHLGLSETNYTLGNIRKAYEHHVSYAAFSDSTYRMEAEKL